MTKVWHVTEGGAAPGLVLAWMKTFPVAGKFAASWVELCPARLAVDRIQFLRIAAAVMIEYQIGIHL
jgi:hypothetical protein